MQQLHHLRLNQSEEISTQELKEKILSKSYQMSLIQLDNPLKIKFLTFTPQIYINLIVTIPKLDFYVKNFWDSLTKGLNENGIQQLLNVYRRRLLSSEEVQCEYQPILQEHMYMFYFLVQNQEDSSPMINEYIKFQLAAGRMSNNMNRWLPKFVMRFANLDYQVLFYCACQFFRNPQNYDFQNQSDKFIQKIKQKFEQFLQKFEGSQHSPEVQKMKELIQQIQITFTIIISSNLGIQHEIYENIFKYLIKSEQFNSQIFLFLKKYSSIAIFDLWIQLLIDLREYSMATFLVENLLYYYCTLAKQARIVEIIERNYDWAKVWAQGLSKNRVSLISPMFMSDQNCFLILNKILIYFGFESDESFLLMLDQIDYIDSVRKFGRQQRVKTSIVDLFKAKLQQYENIIRQMFQWDQNPQI